MSTGSLSELNSQLDRLGKSLDSIASIKSDDKVAFDNKKMQFVAKTIFQSINPFDPKDSFKETINGLHSLKKESETILKAFITILKNNKSLDEETKKQLIDQKVSQIQEKLSRVEFGFEKLKKNHAANQVQYSSISDSIREFRESLVSNLNKIQRLRLPNQFDIFSSYERPFPFNESQSIDDLPLNELEEYALDLKQAERLHGPNASYLQKADAYFYAQEERAAAKARGLHEEFKNTFWGDQPPVADERTDTIVCTLPQLKAGIKMLRKEFPGLTACAYGARQKADISQLLMFIITGVELEPDSDACIRLRELQGKSSPTHEKRASEERSNLFSHFNEILSKPEKMTQKEHLQANLDEGIGCFVRDCIDRPGTLFLCGEKSIRLGPKQDTLFFHDMNQIYTQFLSNNPEQAKTIIESYRNSDFLESLKTLDLPFDEGSQQSVLPEAVLKAILSKHIDPNDPKFEDILAATRIPQDMIEEIARKTGCQAREVEPIMRLKALEAMLIMNQSFSGPLTITMVNTLNAYQNPLDPDLPRLFPTAKGTTFHFTPDFKSVTVNTSWNVNMLAPHYAAENRVELIENAVAIAEVQSTVEFPEFVTKGEQSETVMDDLLLSWKTTNTTLDYLATVINPDPLEAELQNINGTFHEIQKLSPGTNLVPTNGSLKAVPSPKGLTQRSLEIIDSTLIQATHKFQVYANANKNERPDHVKMQGKQLADSISNTALVLNRLIQSNSEDPQKKAAIQKRVKLADQAIQKIEQLLE